MSGYAFHPDAFADLDEIWEYIAQDNVDAADQVLADIHSTVTTLAGWPQIGPLHRARVSQKPLAGAWGFRRIICLNSGLVAGSPADLQPPAAMNTPPPSNRIGMPADVQHRVDLARRAG